MKFLIYFLWIFAGIGLAILFLKSIHESIKLIKPGKKNVSVSLILMTTLLRWIVVFGVFALALLHSPLALGLIFTSFTITRMFLLFRRHYSLMAKVNQAQ